MGLNKAPKSTIAAPAAAVEAKAPAAPVAAAPEPTVNASGVESGAAAAVARLQKKSSGTASTAAAAPKAYVARGSDDARGKTRCVLFQAALASPALAGLKFENIEQYLTLCRQAADYGVTYTFEEGEAAK